MSGPLTLSFHGAARTVTGSKHLLTHEGSRILLDAGLFQGSKRLRKRNWQAPAFDPKSVDHLLLSHTHIDHVGFLPRLVKLGLQAPVHCTPAAHALAELMLLDSAKIQEYDAAYANKKGFSKHKPALPLYDTDDARAALELRRKQRFRQWIGLAPEGNLRARFHNAGHLLGSSFVEIEAKAGARTIRIVYSGDIGRFEVPLHLDPKSLPSCDILILESTYGNRRHSRVPVLEQIRKPFRKTLSRGGTILIPAFAVGRSQQISLMLRRLMKNGQLPEVPIHIDSPMAINATRIYSRFLNRKNIDPDVFEDGRLRLLPEDVHFSKSVEQSKALNNLAGPRIVISSSGMLTGGRVLHHLKRLAPNPKNLLALAGYQAPGTRSRALLDGAESVRVHGRPVPARCEVISIHGLSGHADSGELLRWVEGAPEPPALTFLVHGEPDSSEALAGKLRRKFKTRTLIPDLGDEFDLIAELEKIR